MSVSNLLIRIGKYAMLTLGSVVAVGSLGLGVFGTVYAKNNKDFINTNVSTADDALTTVVTELNNISGTASGTIETIKTEATNVLNQATSVINEQSKNLDTLITQLNSFKDNVSNQPELAQQLEQMISTIQNAKDQVTTLSSTLTEQVNNILNAVDFDQIKQYMDEAVGIANKYIGFIQDEVLVNITPSNVDKYYDMTSQILLIVGATMIGLILVGTLLSLIMYKKVDGKVVSRMRARKELENHLKKILRKNPALLEELKRR